MPLERLEHVNLRTTALAPMCRFYTEVLGLSVGPRPQFPFEGAWLYAGSVPVVHLVVVQEPPAAHAELALEHFAFRASQLSDLLGRLEACGQPHRLSALRDASLCQVHLEDPDGNHLHVDYPLEEALEQGLITA